MSESPFSIANRVEAHVMICAPAAKRPASAGVYGAEGRERREDGADDHPTRRANSESVCAQFPRGAAASTVRAVNVWRNKNESFVNMLPLQCRSVRQPPPV